MSTDYSDSFAQMRSKVVGRDGASYAEMRKGLTPRWIIVWLDMLLTLALWAGVFCFVVRSTSGKPGLQALILVPASAVCGLACHKMTLFLHESSHFNLAPSKSINDVLANVFIA